MVFTKGNRINKGRIPWNKGKKGYLAGEKNPMYGKRHSKEAISKMVAVNLGRKHSLETRKKMSEVHKRLNPSKWGAGFKEGNIPWNYDNARQAYFAGLVDGEGHIAITNNGKVKFSENGRYKRLNIRISMVDGLVVLEEGKEKWGGYIYKRIRSDKNPKWSDYYEWNIQHGNAEKFLRAIKPYLRIKKNQAEVALRYRDLQKKKKLKDGGQGHPYITDAELKYRQELEKQLKTLKLSKGTKSFESN